MIVAYFDEGQYFVKDLPTDSQEQILKVYDVRSILYYTMIDKDFSIHKYFVGNVDERIFERFLQSFEGPAAYISFVALYSNGVQDDYGVKNEYLDDLIDMLVPKVDHLLAQPTHKDEAEQFREFGFQDTGFTLEDMEDIYPILYLHSRVH